MTIRDAFWFIAGVAWTCAVVYAVALAHAAGRDSRPLDGEGGP